LRAIAAAVAPGGVLAIDICDLEWAAARLEVKLASRVGDDWAIVTEYEIPAPDRFVRKMTTFLRNDDGSWRRADERHDNALVDTTLIPAWLEGSGLDVTVGDSFGTERLPVGLKTVIAHRPPSNLRQ
jgi:hypothetical protein